VVTPFLPDGSIRVGITSGASTPDRVVEDVIRRLIHLCVPADRATVPGADPVP
jgi:4-hydroxy-3-methylbut-2-enyl diphosphate reductase